MVFEKIIDAGHSIGNHTCTHLNGWNTPTQNYLNDVYAFEKIFSTRLFRPPYGKIKPNQISKIRKTYQVIFWDVLSGDFDETLTKEGCLANCLKKIKEGSIIVFHDSLKAKEKLEYVLPELLNHFSKQGFLFSSL